MNGEFLNLKSEIKQSLLNIQSTPSDIGVHVGTSEAASQAREQAGSSSLSNSIPSNPEKKSDLKSATSDGRSVTQNAGFPLEGVSGPQIKTSHRNAANQVSPAELNISMPTKTAQENAEAKPVRNNPPHRKHQQGKTTPTDNENGKGGDFLQSEFIMSSMSSFIRSEGTSSPRTSPSSSPDDDIEGQNTVDLNTLAGLVQWTRSSKQKVGKKNVEALLEVAVLAGRIPQRTNHIISAIMPLLEDSSEHEGISSKDVISLIAQLDGFLGNISETDKRILPFLLRSRL